MGTVATMTRLEVRFSLNQRSYYIMSQSKGQRWWHGASGQMYLRADVGKLGSLLPM